MSALPGAVIILAAAILAAGVYSAVGLGQSLDSMIGYTLWVAGGLAWFGLYLVFGALQEKARQEDTATRER